MHCLLYMIDMPQGKTVGIKDLATYQGFSVTYLSKVYSKLQKACMVSSVPRVNGGCALARNPEDITFRDVVKAVEGKAPLFQCVEIRQKKILLDMSNLTELYTKRPCLIKSVMLEVEDQMNIYLNKKTLIWSHSQVQEKIPEEYAKETIEWFNKTKYSI